MSASKLFGSYNNSINSMIGNPSVEPHLKQAIPQSPMSKYHSVEGRLQHMSSGVGSEKLRDIHSTIARHRCFCPETWLAKWCQREQAWIQWLIAMRCAKCLASSIRRLLGRGPGFQGPHSGRQQDQQYTRSQQEKKERKDQISSTH